MKIMNTNKRGTDKMLSVYWFLILFISAAAIVYMVAVFYGHPYDVRELEANILANKIADCVSRGGELVPELFDNDSWADLYGGKNNFWDYCGITLAVEDPQVWKDPQYYAEARIYNMNEVEVFGRMTGNLNLLSSCELQQDEEHERLAKCVEKRFYSVGQGEQYLIKVLSVVRKTEKNVRV
jgi:hypothetical protein